MFPTTKGGTTRILKSDSGEAGGYLRVFVAESSALDLFWLEMVFKSSRLPYWIEVVTTVPAAKQYLERNELQSDLILSDTNELLEHLAANGNIPAFLLTNAPGTNAGDRVIEKPFTRQKLLECLSVAGLDSWAARLDGSEHATAA